MPDSSAEIKCVVTVKQLGDGCERVATDREMTILRRILSGRPGRIESDTLLGKFAAFMALDIERDVNNEVPGEVDQRLMRVAGMATDFALRLRHVGSLPEWPDNCVPAGFVYGIAEKWLDDNPDGITVKGQTPREYFLDDNNWQEAING